MEKLMLGIIICIVLFVLIVGLLVFFYYLSYSRSKKEQLSRKTCAKCGKRYELETSVKYKVISEEKHITQNRNSTIKTVAFVCTCLNCGNTKKFTEEFDVGGIIKSGTAGHRVHKKYSYKLEDMIQRYFQS